MIEKWIAPCVLILAAAASLFSIEIEDDPYRTVYDDATDRLHWLESRCGADSTGDRP